MATLKSDKWFITGLRLSVAWQLIATKARLRSAYAFGQPLP
jgi:hypothetical protein